MPWGSMSRADLVLRAFASLVFLAAGVLKVLSPAAFALSIARLQILPGGWIGTAAIVLPWIEVVAGIALLLVPSHRAAARGILGALLVVFSAALVLALARGISTCGCFGTDGGLLERPAVALLRNGLLMAALLLTGRSGPASPASGTRR